MWIVASARPLWRWWKRPRPDTKSGARPRQAVFYCYKICSKNYSNRHAVGKVMGFAVGTLLFHQTMDVALKTGTLRVELA